MRARALATIALAAAVFPAAAQAKTGSIFDITEATGYERVTFMGDDTAGCAEQGVCGVSGTVTFRIGSATPRGALFLARSRSGRISGGATYRTSGMTTASVGDCTDTVEHRTDVFSVNSIRTSPETLLLAYHRGAGDYLDSACQGLTERDLAEAGALPEGAFPAKGFSRTRLRFKMSGSQPFEARGFSAASEWSLSFRGKARECNPRCRIPAHRPR